jgi:hypothetical protein
VKYIDESTGYGVFAKKDIPENSLIGELFSEFYDIKDYF